MRSNFEAKRSNLSVDANQVTSMNTMNASILLPVFFLPLQVHTLSSLVTSRDDFNQTDALFYQEVEDTDSFGSNHNDDDTTVTVHLNRAFRRQPYDDLRGTLHLRFQHNGRSTERSFKIR